MFFFILYRDSADGRGSGYKRNGKLRIEGFRIQLHMISASTTTLKDTMPFLAGLNI